MYSTAPRIYSYAKAYMSRPEEGSMATQAVEARKAHIAIHVRNVAVGSCVLARHPPVAPLDAHELPRRNTRGGCAASV